ncbi:MULTISPECIES: hypothetical protein [unclassified Frankia]|uniref:hypothetical protein n=1 Tax=unclassified Frankia TaxID=2632575 RepID=UPI002AD5ABDE|nr:MULTISPECIES: hypothetical protein [unclassified Frankia]
MSFTHDWIKGVYAGVCDNRAPVHRARLAGRGRVASGRCAESASQAACRILREQVGLDVVPARLWPIGTQHNWTPAGSRIDLYFTPGVFHGIPVIMNRACYEDLRWFDQDQLPQDLASHVRAAVDAFRKPESYGETGWPDRALPA